MYLSLKPLPHQLKFIQENTPKVLLDWECRVGKTIPACYWVDHPNRNKNTFIICKKSNKKMWQNMGTKATVYTKEEFKKYFHTIKNPTAIVIDEVHKFGAPLFAKPRSELATSLYNLLRNYPNCHFLGLSGTMVRNSPWSFHTLMCYVGVYIDWKQYREEMFELKHMPFLRFPTYFPKKDCRARVDIYRKKYCNQISLKEVVDYLPPVSSRIIKIKQSKYVLPKDEIVTWTDEHLHEQRNKYKEILELEYKKVIVVAYYTQQILELAEKLSKEKPVFILNGQTKDQEATIKEAQEAEECYFIVQAGCGEGWDGHMFGVMVFASMAHPYVDNVQMHERQRNIKNLRDLEIIYLIGGRWDAKILNSFKNGEDFNPHK
jgi:superfamily II DNA or RNA helicase